MRCALKVINCTCRLDLGSVCKLLHGVITESSSLWHAIRFRHADFCDIVKNPTYNAQRTAFVQHRISAIRNMVIGPDQVGRSNVSACSMQ